MEFCKFLCPGDFAGELAARLGVSSLFLSTDARILNDWALMDIALRKRFSFFFIMGLIIDFVNADETRVFFLLRLLVSCLVNYRIWVASDF